MRSLVKSLIVLLLLSSCGTSQESRYRDTASLELPPALQKNAQPVKPVSHDDSAVPDASDHKGLGTGVYMTTTEPAELKIKQSFDIAWNSVESALRQTEIEIKDRELDKGLYYVIFDPDQYVPESETVVGRFGSLFTNDYSQAVYVLTLTADGDETQITAARANQADQGGLSDHEDKPEESDEKTDGAQRLLLFLHKTLRDDLIEK